LAKVMNTSEIALPIRPGEHAWCRFGRPEDRERLTVAFIRAGLGRGYKVTYLYEPDSTDGMIERLKAADPQVAPALASGQFELESARDTYLPDGTFDPTRMAATLRSKHRLALAEGFTGIAITGDVPVVAGEPDGETLARYEQEFEDEPFDASRVILCHHPLGRPLAARQADPECRHDVDVSPELAPIGREGSVSAARVRSSDALRLAGELDFHGAPAVSEVLAAHFHGTLRLDLADLTYVDVAGMRALRGRTGQPVAIDGASEAVMRLAELLAWDTDPDVDLRAA
jgi:ABC-type transporter Mla MlaB component